MDGHEKTFQVNHLAPFLLTTELMDVLTASKATVINTSSAANALRQDGPVRPRRRRDSYSTNRAYGTAKLANILFTTELHRRYGEQGITTAAFHPGVVATNFAADSTSPMRHAYKSFLNRFMLTPDQGADTLLWLATAPPGTDWVSGAYYAKRALAKANTQAYDAGLAARAVGPQRGNGGPGSRQARIPAPDTLRSRRGKTWVSIFLRLADPRPGHVMGECSRTCA